AGAVVGMRDIDNVKLGLAEIGDRDVTVVENEGIGAAAPGQGIVDVVATVAAVENVVVVVAREVIAELRAEQVGDIGQRIGSRAESILWAREGEADRYAGRRMFVTRGV